MRDLNKEVLDLVISVPGLAAGEVAVHLQICPLLAKHTLRKLAERGLVESRLPQFVRKTRTLVWHPMPLATGVFTRRVVKASECAPIRVAVPAPVSVFNLAAGMA